MSKARSPRALCSMTVGTSIGAPRSPATIELHYHRRIRGRRATRRLHMPDDGNRVEREVVLPAPADVVWQAITDAEELSGWFGAEVELDPRPGGAARFVVDGGDVRRAVVEAVEPERHLRFVWW